MLDAFLTALRGWPLPLPLLLLPSLSLTLPELKEEEAEEPGWGDGGPSRCSCGAAGGTVAETLSGVLRRGAGLRVTAGWREGQEHEYDLRGGPLTRGQVRGRGEYVCMHACAHVYACIQAGRQRAHAIMLPMCLDVLPVCLSRFVASLCACLYLLAACTLPCMYHQCRVL